MHELVKSAKTDPIFINLIKYIIRHCTPRDHEGELKTIYNAWYNKIKYLRDPHQVENLQSVWETIKNRAGDCDCTAVLIASSVGAIGYPYRFVTIKADSSRKDEFSHIFTQASQPGKGWVTMDISLRSPDYGFTPTGWEHKYWPEPVY